jgi:hypothetical protein
LYDIILKYLPNGRLFISATAIAFRFSITVAHILKLTEILVQVLIQINSSYLDQILIITQVCELSFNICENGRLFMSATAIAFLFLIAVAHILKLTEILVQVLIQINSSYLDQILIITQVCKLSFNICENGRLFMSATAIAF